jgi:uncharacterized repeat protein (TIGR01451 family)
MLLSLVYLLTGSSLGAVAPSLTINQLVTSEQTVTLQAPSGDYYYQWTAETGGATISQATSQSFSFKAPLVTQDEGSKAVIISLYIRTKEGGCVNQTSTTINVYSLPVCGISGPAQVGPYETATYSYSGGTSGRTTFVWSVDGKNIDGATGPNVAIDWTQYSPVNHTIGMAMTKDYSDVAPGSTNPFRSTSCTFQTNVTYTTGMQVTKTPSTASAAVGESVTYTYTVQNTGTIGINNLAMSDDKLGTLTPAAKSILPGESTTATASYTIKESDLPGPLNNTVTVSGAEDRTNRPVSATASATVALTYNAALNLTKVPSSTTAKVGDTVTYRFTVTNTGNVTIKGLNLTDNKLGTIKTDKNELAPGATATASATHVVLESDLPGPLTNLATIQGTDIQNQPVTATASASIELTYTSGLAVTKKASSTTAKVGDVVTYQFSVTNNGTVTINGLALNDDKLGAVTLDKASLLPGETATGTASHTINETDLPGPLTNIATATGTDSQGVAVTGQATATVQLTYTATLQVTKTPSTTTANVGETVTYQFQVKNTGSVTINSLTLVDDKLGAVTLDRDSLPPGETANGTATHLVAEGDLPGPLTNIVTATGTDRVGAPVTATATATVRLTYTAALQVTKTPSASTAAIGDTVTYQFSVVNTGNVTVNALTLTDDKLGEVTLDTASLAPGATATGTATHTIVETDLPGPLTNTATAKATDSQNKPVTATTTATVTLTYTSSMSVTKVPSSTTARVGESITYTYTVNNTGSISINGLALSDDKLGKITTDRTSLAPGESASGTITYTVLEGDLPGPIINTVTATATDSLRQPVTATASATVTLTYTASMTVDKVPSSPTARVGDRLTYTYTVRNTGNVTLNALALSDDKIGAITPAKTTLASGESTTATGTYTVLEGDLPGPLTNLVTVTATDSQNQPVTTTTTATVTLSYVASMSVTKVPSSTTAGVGEQVTYTYTVRNTGNVTLNGLALSDNKIGTITPGQATLASGETTTATGTYTVLESDLPGPLTNTVTVTATDSQNQPVTTTTTASVDLTYATKLEVAKVASTGTAAVGSTITYSYTVRNAGTVTINGLTMNDDKLGSITLDSNTLAPGATANGTATHLVVEGDLPGPLVNTVTVSGTDSQNNPATATASATVALTYTAALQVTKTPSATTAAIGETVTYQFTVVNTGNVTVNALTLTDDKLGEITLNTASLAAGETVTGTATHTIVETDLPGPLTNVATAKGTDSQNKPVTATATATVNLTYTATMEVTKSPSAASARVGESITYTYTVRNTGTVSIKGLKLSDDKLKEIKVDKDTLVPDDTATGTATYTILETDLPGPLTNIVTVTATDSTGKAMTGEASASVDLTYSASMEITKTASATTANVGDTVTYSYTVRNTGEVTINDLALTDDKLGAITINANTLAAGQTATGTSSHIVVEGDLPGPLTNTVTGTATDSQGQPVTNTTTATVTLTYTASMSVTKVPSSTTAGVGEQVTYTYTVENTGNVTLSGLTLSDDKIGAITPGQTTLASGESTTATGTYTVLEGDLPGPLTNTVTVTATDNLNQAVTTTQTATVSLTYVTKLEVAKEASTGTAAVGSTITYNYTVKNSGTVTINGLTMTDDKLGAIALDTNTVAPGASANGSATHLVVEGDLPGPLVNTVTVSGTDSQNNAASASASATVALTYTSSISLAKTATSTSPLWIAGGGAKLGDDIVYTYVVSNTGTTTVSGIVVVDDKLGQVTLDRNTLAAGEKATGSLTHKVVQTDMGEELKSSIVNTATSTGTSIGTPITSNVATVTAGVYRDAITPTLECVSHSGVSTSGNEGDKSDKKEEVSASIEDSYTAFFGYSNTNSVAVSLSAGKNNQFTPPPDSQGQPTTFEPGTQTAVFAVDFKGNSLVWHLDGKTVEANKNSPGCSQAGCGLDGPAALCQNKKETYSYTGKEDEKFKQNYDWFMDDKSVGSGKSITLSGEKFEMGEHKLKLKVGRNYREKAWSSTECSMDVKVIPEPSADISMTEEE